MNKRKILYRIWLVVIICAGLSMLGPVTIIHARKVSTTLKTPPKSKVKKKHGSRPEYESIVVKGRDSLFWAEKVVFAGFDKQPNSSVESFHISNRSDRLIRQLTVEITYVDTKGRMLHRRTETLKTEIPAGETRKIDIKSFDSQHSFYYVLSNPPKRVATPFDVKMVLRSLQLGK